jgi:hypothetical protein
MSTTWELLEGAALSLARANSIKDRLSDAYRNHLALVDADELPEGVRVPFRNCLQVLTREAPLRGEDAVRATVRKMSNQEAEQAAAAVIGLFAALVREYTRESHTDADAGGRTKPLKAVPQVISLYAAEGSRAPNRA